MLPISPGRLLGSAGALQLRSDLVTSTCHLCFVLLLELDDLCEQVATLVCLLGALLTDFGGSPHPCVGIFGLKGAKVAFDKLQAVDQVLFGGQQLHQLLRASAIDQLLLFLPDLAKLREDLVLFPHQIGQMVSRESGHRNLRKTKGVAKRNGDYQVSICVSSIFHSLRVKLVVVSKSASGGIRSRNSRA